MAYEAALVATPPKIANRARTERQRLLITMMREMQRLVGGPFKLSSHQLGRLFGVPHTRAWDWLRSLETAGVIECLNRGRAGRPGHGAAVFKYLGD